MEKNREKRGSRKRGKEMGCSTDCGEDASRKMEEEE